MTTRKEKAKKIGIFASLLIAALSAFGITINPAIIAVIDQADEVIEVLKDSMSDTVVEE